MIQAALIVAVLCPFVHADDAPGRSAAKKTPELFGRLSTVEDLPVLELWGSPEQAGYAHGYLMAERILPLIDDYMLAERILRDSRVYTAMLLPNVRRQFVWPERFETELAAVLRGMRDRLGAERVRSKVLDRELELEDLLAANALSDWFGFLCSTFSAWGPLTEDGGTLTARNLDFPQTTSMARGQIIVVYRGDDERAGWVGVSWPGMVGVYTAMNADGVTMLMHDAVGLTTSHAFGFTPRSLVLRLALESAKAKSFVDDVRGVFSRHKVMVGNNIHVSGPRRGDAAPAAVFEYDANEESDGVTVRRSDADAGLLANALWCTNHMRQRRPARPCDRYAVLGEGLAELADGGTPLTPKGAMRLIRAARQRSTLHSVVFLPHEREMYVMIPALGDRLIKFEADRWLRAKATAGAAANTEKTP